MALRPLAFGLRFRDRDRTLRVRTRGGAKRPFAVEDSRAGGTHRREHASLADALRDVASTWRGRLH